MSVQAKFARLRAAVEASPFKSWAAFTDDSGSKPHTNLVAFVSRTECVLELPGRNKREPLVEFLAAATPKTVAELLAERDELLTVLQSLMPKTLIGESYDPPVPADEVLKEFLFTWGKLRAARAAIAKAMGQDGESAS